MNPPPPIPHDCGRATLMANTVAAAASTALPPAARTSRPMRAAAGDSVAIAAVGDVTAAWNREPSAPWAGTAASARTSAAAKATQRSTARQYPERARSSPPRGGWRTVFTDDDSARARTDPSAMAVVAAPLRSLRHPQHGETATF